MKNTRCKEISNSNFDESMSATIQNFRDCVNKYTTRACSYSNILTNNNFKDEVRMRYNKSLNSSLLVDIHMVIVYCAVN